jgi:hypothetical protein
MSCALMRQHYPQARPLCTLVLTHHRFIAMAASRVETMRVLPSLTHVGHEWSLFAAMHVGVLAGAAQQIELRVRHAFYPKFNASVIIPHLRCR